MYFKVNNIQKKDVLHSTNENLDNRWSVVAPQYLTEVIGQNFTWAKYLDREARMYERTRPYPGYDSKVGRPVMVKVLKYTEDEVLNPSLVMNKRKVLEEQIHMLNALATPLLPEPLDWFQVSNTVDGFTDKSISETEPVLVLDYIPGETLPAVYKKNQFMRFEVVESETGAKEYKENGINVTKICMFISRNIDFLRVLNDKGYMFLGLSPEHILVLKNEIPRFLGLGRICKTVNGKFDSNHINFGRMIRGYSAPELNKVETNFGQNANALAAGVYSVGVILAQMIYGDFEIYEDTLSSGSISYPNERYREKILNSVPQKGVALDKLITRLCDPDPNKRLTDLNEIDSILREIGGISLNEEKGKMEVNKSKKTSNGKNVIQQKSESFIPKTKQVTITEAVVEKFDKKECVGVVREIKTGEEIKITSELLSSSGLSFLVVNSKVRLTNEHIDNGMKIVTRVGLILNEKKQPVKVTQSAEQEKKESSPKSGGTKSQNQSKGGSSKTSPQGKSTNSGDSNVKKGATAKGGTKKKSDPRKKKVQPKTESVGGNDEFWAELREESIATIKKDEEAAFLSDFTPKDDTKIVIDESNLGEVGFDVVGKIVKKKISKGLSKEIDKVIGYLTKTREKLESKEDMLRERRDIARERLVEKTEKLKNR